MAKQRFEIQPLPTPTGVPLLSTPAAVAVPVETKPGEINVWDRAKAYYHTIIAVVVAVLVIVVEVAPALDPALALLPPKWRGYIALALLIAGPIYTKVKSNELWAAAPRVPDPDGK